MQEFCFWIKITTFTWYIWVFSLPVCWIVGEYGREKMHVNHFWELKGYRIFFPFFDWLLWLLVIWLWFYNTQSYSFYFLRFNVIFLVVKLLIKVNEIKVKKGVELAQHLVEFYYAQVKWVFPIENATKSSLIMTAISANWRMYWFVWKLISVGCNLSLQLFSAGITSSGKYERLSWRTCGGAAAGTFKYDWYFRSVCPPRSGKSFFFPAGIYQWQIQTLGGEAGP